MGFLELRQARAVYCLAHGPGMNRAGVYRLSPGKKVLGMEVLGGLAGMWKFIYRQVLCYF